MKLLKIIFSIILLSTLLWSCKEEDLGDFLQISNTTSKTVSIKIDTTSYEIESMQRTDFFSIEEGYHKFTGDYIGNFAIDECKGTHYWVLEILADSVALNLQQPE